jgi:hypothetical protein
MKAGERRAGTLFRPALGMEARLTSGSARADRPSVIRFRPGLTIGRHSKPLPPRTMCLPDCEYCPKGEYSDITLGGFPKLSPKFHGLPSRLHARIHLDPDVGFQLENLSMNLTSVDGVQLQPGERAPLHEGSHIIFGSRNDGGKANAKWLREYVYNCHASLVRCQHSLHCSRRLEVIYSPPALSSVSRVGERRSSA